MEDYLFFNRLYFWILASGAYGLLDFQSMSKEQAILVTGFIAFGVVIVLVYAMMTAHLMFP